MVRLIASLGGDSQANYGNRYGYGYGYGDGDG